MAAPFKAKAQAHRGAEAEHLVQGWGGAGQGWDLNLRMRSGLILGSSSGAKVKAADQR